MYGTAQPYGISAQTFFPPQVGFGFGVPSQLFGVPGVPGFQGISPYGVPGVPGFQGISPYGVPGVPGFQGISPYGVPGVPGFQGISPFGGFTPQLAPQAWYGNPVGTVFSQLNNPIAQQAVQQIPHLVQNANQIAQQVPQLITQIPQIIQQNPQLVQQAPQLQQIPQLLQQAAVLAQQVPHVLQALCTTPTLSGGYGVNPWGGTVGGFRPFA